MTTKLTPELWDHYKDDGRWAGGVDALRAYIDRTPLTRKEAGFYRRLLRSAEVAHRTEGA